MENLKIVGFQHLGRVPDDVIDGSRLHRQPVPFPGRVVLVPEPARRRRPPQRRVLRRRVHVRPGRVQANGAKEVRHHLREEVRDQERPGDLICSFQKMLTTVR